MSELGDYGLSLKIEKALRLIARQEVEAARPATRMAQVAGIDTVNRTLTVIFTGEVEQVKVPYTSQVPANVGQYVRIGGTTHDRYVEDIIGTTGIEARAQVLEEDRIIKQEAFGSWKLGGAFGISNNVARVPYSNPIFNQVGSSFSIQADGLLTFNEPGYYRVDAAFGYTVNEDDGANDVFLYLQHIPLGASGTDIVMDQKGGAAPATLRVWGINHFKAGDAVSINVFSYLPRNGRQTDMLLTCQLLKRIAEPV